MIQYFDSFCSVERYEVTAVIPCAVRVFLAYPFYTQKFVPRPVLTPALSPLVTTGLLSASVSLQLFGCMHSFVLFFRFHT